MNFHTTDDKAFFAISAILGTLTEYKNIVSGTNIFDYTFNYTIIVYFLYVTYIL